MAVQDIQERTVEYALRAIRLYRELQRQRDGAGWFVGRQFVRAATSIGANVAEAQGGESRADFIHKCSIAQKEARESKYWLTLLSRAEIIANERLAELLDETEQIIAILARIILTARKNL